MKTYEIENDFLKVCFIDYGGTIIGIYDKQNGHENLVISFDDVNDYIIEGEPYLNSLVGPVAGRIAHGQYELDGKIQQLSINSHINHLHGGQSGISKHFFKIVLINDYSALCSLRTNHDGDGFVGQFDYQVIYRLEDSKLIIEYEATPEHRTILNMTSHLYFNLSGDMKSSIEDHLIKIEANKRMTLHEDEYPLNIVDLETDDVFDCRNTKKLSEIHNSFHPEIVNSRGLNHAYLLDGSIYLMDEVSGRQLKLTTDAPSAVFYSANYFNDSYILNKRQRGYPHCGIAIETQDIPNGINVVDDKESFIYGPHRVYRQKTSYEFSNLIKGK